MGTYSSLFKQKPAHEPPIPGTPPTQSIGEELDERTQPLTNERNSERTEERTVFRSEMRTEDLPVKRRTKRYSFEFYEDQIFQLKRLKREAEDQGETLMLSDMAREAFDLYLKNRK